MNYWLLKSEPNVWSIDQQIKAGAKGAVLGGMTGATNAFLTQKGVGVLGRTLAEVAEFGTVSPALEDNFSSN